MCGGKGHIGDAPCRVCKTTGWVEILGCGMLQRELISLRRLLSGR